MKFLKFWRNGFGLFLFFSFGAEAQQKFVFLHQQMGTFFTVSCFANDSLSANYAVNQSFKKLDELNQIMSDYREDSELNLLCKTAGTNTFVKVSPDLFQILKYSIQAAELSDKAFDITLGSMTQLWRRMKRQRKMPSYKAIEQAKKSVGIENIIIKGDSVQLKKTGIHIDLGGIGKGFAEDEMMKMLKENNITQAIIEGGGNILISNSPPKSRGWEVKINEKKYFLKNCGVSTSGDFFQFVEIDGKKYSHILDPKTGLGMTKSIQVTVIAPNGTTSDWLSTAFCLMNETQRKKIAQNLKAKYFVRE